MRNWKSWRKRTADELNGIAGVTGIGGTLMGAAGLTVFAGTAAASALSGGGALIAVGTVLYAAWKAIPPILMQPEQLVRQSIQLTELDQVYPPLRKLALLGPTAVGKTTLKQALSLESIGRTQTQTITAQIISVPLTPPKYLAVLDGAGEWNTQQFRIAEAADYLCLILDHNLSHTDSALSRTRLTEIDHLFGQLRNHLIQAGLPRKRWIEILINKRDLWQTASQQDQNEFRAFYEDQLQKWKNSNFADSVTMHHHSNERIEDISRFMSLLQTSIQR